jgi:hypothetical protein
MPRCLIEQRALGSNYLKRSRHRLREETGKACRLEADLVTVLLYVESQAENRLSLLLAFPSSQDVFNLPAI